MTFKDATIHQKRLHNRLIAPSLQYESPLWERGIQWVAGVDEAGRGALAGPVMAGAVILPAQADLLILLSGVRDSKLMSPQDREKWSASITRVALAWSVGSASHEEIDQLGILPATRLAVQRALSLLTIEPEFLLLDYLILRECEIPQIAIVKGDLFCLSIAAASILAKTTRDSVMNQAEQEFPGYGFARHKGYGTTYHRKMLAQIGPCPLHRMTFQWKRV